MAKQKKTAARPNGNKTTLNDGSVAAYIAAITDEARRADCAALVKLFRAATGKPAKMWGTSIVGFDQYHYRYDSGREGDMCAAGFSSRKGDLTLYLHTQGQESLLARLGRHKGSKACIYIKRLADVDAGVLKQLITASVASIKRLYP